MSEPTDHEAIMLLRKDVQIISEKQTTGFNALSKSQDDFHKEVKESFVDLKDNYSDKINKLEGRTKSLEDWRMIRLQAIKDEQLYNKFLIGLGLVIMGVLAYHLTGVKFI